MGCRAQPVRYPISRTVQQMTRETRMGQPSYTEFRILPPRETGGLILNAGYAVGEHCVKIRLSVKFTFSLIKDSQNLQQGCFLRALPTHPGQ